MNDGFGAGIFVGLMLSLLLHACTPVDDHVKPENWKKAEVACATFGGIKKVEREAYDLSNFEVHCNNGMAINIKREDNDV